ncbi:hypothetical protein F4810DRAFT_721983 [Camillea tinctor]|nr:hypothetical protein F4810DRAFT_721983 [Camillea tinctor]
MHRFTAAHQWRLEIIVERIADDFPWLGSRQVTRAAVDEVQNYDLEKTAGDSRYLLHVNPKNPAQRPSSEASLILQELNESQTLQDTAAREPKQAQWNPFSIWWCYTTDTTRDSSQNEYTKEIEAALSEVLQLSSLYRAQACAVENSRDKINDLKLELKTATDPDFQQQRDPTLFIGEVKASWPKDHLEPLQVRLGPQVARYSEQPIPATYGFECVPLELQSLATKLAHEFDYYANPVEYRDIHDTQAVPPLYHYQNRDQWMNRQPWFPLFLELSDTVREDPALTTASFLPAFKPAIHGLFCLTKLNIIDKFGQAVAAIDPKPRVEGPPPLSPHIGEYYRPQKYKDGNPNIIEKPKKPGECPYIQMPPGINQPVRLHMNWVKLQEYGNKSGEENGKNSGDSSSGGDNVMYEWRPLTEWGSPIWVVINYVNYGVQFFLGDGTFYREMRIASPNNPESGAVAGDKWLPLQPPGEDPKRQLDKLIKQFTDDRDYLLNVMEMTNTAVAKSPSVPGAYSRFTNSLVGRPLALANAGFSLELATYALRNQSRSSPVPHDALVLDDISTPFPNKPDHVKPIDEESYLRLQAFWTGPRKYITSPNKPGDAANYVCDRNRQLTVRGMLVDPFTPVNAYSSALPVGTLSLALWTWESSLLKMTAFFHMGPLMVEDDGGRGIFADETADGNSR